MEIRLTIDGREVKVGEGATIMEAADAVGIRIPRFCHHPELTSPASCRVCAVEVKGTPGVVMSCREPARDGMEVFTDTLAARRAREDVLEFMLANHPVDCPVCDRAGECDLQDIYFENSRRPSRFAERKVKKTKAARIGPHVVLDAERCVGCTRCVRFLEEVVGAPELGIFRRGDRMEVGVVEGCELANPYSLCTVDLCPVGALTSADFRFKKRAWELTSSPTICAGCARGCSAWLDSADGVGLRLRPRSNPAVNGEWMCDEGRMTYRVLDPARRLATPIVLDGGDVAEADYAKAIGKAAGLMRGRGDAEVVTILSAKASLEENLAVAKFAKNVLGSERLLSSSEPLDQSFEDSILRVASRDPNLKGVEMIAPTGSRDIPRGAGAVILERPSDDDLMALMGAGPSWVILIAQGGAGPGRWADVVFPRPSHFEQEGTFVGCDGRAQRFHGAVCTDADILPVWELMGGLAKELGTSWDLDSPGACLRWGASSVEAFKKLAVSDFPPEGILL